MEPPLHERCAADNHSSILTGLCKPEHGWARALAGELLRLLQSALGRDVNVRVNVVARNAIFNTCRQSGDHGPINSWDRQAYLTKVRDPAGGWAPKAVAESSYICMSSSEGGQKGR